MNDVRDGVMFHGPEQCGGIGDVARQAPGPRGLFIIHNQAPSPLVRTLIEDHDLCALSQQTFHNPGTDKTVCAGD
jgi:hypothetical protein